MPRNGAPPDPASILAGSQALLETRSRVDGIRRQRAETVLAQARSALDSGNADLAEQLAKKALAISPDLAGIDDFNLRLRNARLYASLAPGEVIRDRFLDVAGSAPPLVVVPTGEFVTWGTPTKKFSAGFNLRDLWIGSEGMLGLVTDATLKLIPKPAARWTLLAAFDTEPAAFRAVRALFAQRLQPAICEFLDRYSVLCAERATGATVFAGQAGRPVLLIELAGSASEVAEQKQTVLAWARTHALAHRAARDREEAEALWAVRRKCSGAMTATTVSAQERRESRVSRAIVGAATTMWSGRCSRTAARAALIVEPVAMPSSTRITVFPRTSGAGAP